MMDLFAVHRDRTQGSVASSVLVPLPRYLSGGYHTPGGREEKGKS